MRAGGRRRAHCERGHPRLDIEWARDIAINTALTGNQRLFVSVRAGYSGPIVVRTCYRMSGHPFDQTDGDEYVHYLGYRFDTAGRRWAGRTRGSRAPEGATVVGWDKADDFDPGTVACFHYGTHTDCQNARQQESRAVRR